MSLLSKQPKHLGSVAGFLSRTVVVIPAWNEEPCVGEAVRRWLASGASRVRVVDNGSTDRTATVAAAAGAEVMCEPRRGYGAAAWRGLQEWPLDCDRVLFSSADGSDRLSNSQTSAWQEAIDEGFDLILGDRVSPGDQGRTLAPLQRVGNRVCCTAIAALWGRRFQDLSSMRLVRREALMQLCLKDRGFGWNLEMQVRAIEQGWRIAELRVNYFPRTGGTSKISGTWLGSFKAGYGLLACLARLWLRRRRTMASPVSAHVSIFPRV